jgi:predicted O-linked N-acetylglucosamine transferase (SPINDLY family)
MLLWKDILNQVPGSVLAVPAYNDVELRVFHRILRAAGIGSSRIVSYSPADMSRFDNIDAVLGFAGSSATDVVEALDHSCPVIAMRGPTAIERTSLSVLARRNVAELAADSAKDYVQLAIRFANDATWRNDLHAKLAEPPSTTPPGQRDVATLQAARKAIEDGAALTTGQ